METINFENGKEKSNNNFSVKLRDCIENQVKISEVCKKKSKNKWSPTFELKERLLYGLFTSPNAVFRDYDSQERSASEVKQEIERHLKDKETLENSLPSSIVIGPYWISTEGVKQALAKKRKALANAVIELLAKKLRKQADMVCDISL